MRRTRGVAAACVVASVFAAAPAFAQSQPPEPEPVGSGRGAGSGSSLTLSFTERFDTNVPRIDDTGFNARGLVKRDIRVTPSADLLVSQNIGRHQIAVRSSVGYDVYARNTQLNSWRFLVQPTAYLDLPVCDVRAEASVSRRQSDLGELVYFGVDPTFDTRNIEVREGVEGSLLCGESRGLRPTFTVAYDAGRNENPLRSRSNFQSTRLQPGVSYSSPVVGTVSAYAVRVDTDLPDRPATGGISGYRQTGYGVSYLRDIGRYLNFDGSLSFVEVRPNDGSNVRRSGANYDIALTVQPSEQLQIMAQASRAFSSALTNISTYELNENYALRMTYAMNSQVRLSFGGAISPRQFFYDDVPQGLFIGKQTLKSIFAGARTSIGRRLKLSLNAGYDTRQTDIGVREYKAFHTSVGLSFQY